MSIQYPQASGRNSKEGRIATKDGCCHTALIWWDFAGIHAQLPIEIYPCKMTSAAVVLEPASLTPTACVGAGSNGIEKKCAKRLKVHRYLPALNPIW